MTNKRQSFPLVSIVIPAYNADQYLNEAIDSVLNQSYSNIELIVIDDGSTDNTREVLERYAKGSFYYESQSNIGQSAALNKGWGIARGEILSYLSADDVLLDRAVSVSIETLAVHKEVVMTYCDYLLIDAKSEDLRRVYAPEFNYENMVSDIIVQPGPGVFFHRSLFDKIGGWNPSYRQVPDFEYWLRLGLQGDFFRIPEVLAKFRVHNGSQTHMESSVEKAEECLQVIDAYFNNSALPRAVQCLERRSKGNAHLFVARMHLRAGRYNSAIAHLRMMAVISPRLLLSIRSIRMLVNGLLFRIKRARS